VQGDRFGHLEQGAVLLRQRLIAWIRQYISMIPGRDQAVRPRARPRVLN
jgi:hypothetical protein